MFQRPLNPHLIRVVGLACLCWSILLSSQVRVQATGSFDVAAPLAPKAYLPIVVSQRPRTFSGIHLGNRNSATKPNDWNTVILGRLDPRLGGTWPNVVVVLSDQLYQINRNKDDISPVPYNCQIASASPRGDRPVLWDYVKRAGKAGVRIVVRLYPSPGNFLDWDDPKRQNHLLSSGLPAGLNGYCAWNSYRSYDDLGDEILAIHKLNMSAGFSEFGFEPANEPNVEWYSGDSVPAVSDSTAWDQMDTYFAKVHRYVHAVGTNMDIRVLTPPMSQARFAETHNIEVIDPVQCKTPMQLTNGKSGYETMPSTFGDANDGISWHNYWLKGLEVYSSCEAGGGMHVEYYFPQTLKDVITRRNLLTVITEADLKSNDPNLPNKDDANAAVAADSLRHFVFSSNNFAKVQSIAAWLLNDNTNQTEVVWHQAYSDVNIERKWFELWWTGSEKWP